MSYDDRTPWYLLPLDEALRRFARGATSFAKDEVIGQAALPIVGARLARNALSAGAAKVGNSADAIAQGVSEGLAGEAPPTTDLPYYLRRPPITATRPAPAQPTVPTMLTPVGRAIPALGLGATTGDPAVDIGVRPAPAEGAVATSAPSRPRIRILRDASGRIVAATNMESGDPNVDPSKTDIFNGRQGVVEDLPARGNVYQPDLGDVAYKPPSFYRDLARKADAAENMARIADPRKLAAVYLKGQQDLAKEDREQRGRLEVATADTREKTATAAEIERGYAAAKRRIQSQAYPSEDDRAADLAALDSRRESLLASLGVRAY